LLAIRGHQGERPPTIGELADYLLIQPHSAAELVSRAEQGGLVRRLSDPDDGRVVRLELTARGTTMLHRITSATLKELDRLGPRLRGIWKGLAG
jgi:DNA-binding MarR family transcriptional regulator